MIGVVRPGGGLPQGPATVPARLARLAAALDHELLGKTETIRLLLICLLAREHAVLIGPPGTAKSALLTRLSGLVAAPYFEYLLTRFTEPNEIFGPVDIAAYREGVYRRRTDGMLPEAEIVFLDEIFKSNSAILNSLLSLLNDRRFASGGTVIECPLISVFGASNEVPSDESLAALFDRFLLRIRSDYLDSYHFDELVTVGLAHEAGRQEKTKTAPLISSAELKEAAKVVASRVHFPDEFLAQYKSLVFQIRAEGISLSDRRVVKLLKLFSASAYLADRADPDVEDLLLLRHVWNSEDQAATLDRLVVPVVDAFYAEHPERRGGGPSGRSARVESLAAEVERIRRILLGGAAPSDVQLFSQLKALGELRTALASLEGDDARTLERRIAELLEASLKSGHFGDP